MDTSPCSPMMSSKPKYTKHAETQRKVKFKVSTSNCWAKILHRKCSDSDFCQVAGGERTTALTLWARQPAVPSTSYWKSQLSLGRLIEIHRSDWHSCKEVNGAMINNPCSWGLRGLYSRCLCSIFVINWLYQLQVLKNNFLGVFCKHLSVEIKQCNGAQEISAAFLTIP